MDGYLKQSTASQTRWIGPFVDDTDFKTAETGLTIANTDIKVSKNGGASASKNSGGGTHDVNGYYAVTWDATDTATVGQLTYSVKVAGALQVFGSYVVLEEAIYDALFAASATGALPVSSGGLTASSIAADAITAANLAADVTTELQSGLATAAALTTVDTVVDAIQAKTDNLPSDPADASVIAAAFAVTDGKIDTVDDLLDTEVAAIKTDTAAIKAKTDNLPGDPADASVLANVVLTAHTVTDALITTVDTVVDAIKLKTDNLPASPAAVGSAMTLDLTQALDLTPTDETVGDALLAARAQGFGKWAISGTTLTLYAEDGTTALRAFTLDDADTPTSRTPT